MSNEFWDGMTVGILLAVVSYAWIDRHPVAAIPDKIKAWFVFGGIATILEMATRSLSPTNPGRVFVVAALLVWMVSVTGWLLGRAADWFTSLKERLRQTRSSSC